MVELECLVCGKAIKIPQFIDTDNYDGQLVCHKCNSLLHVKLVASKVRKYKVVENKKERDIKIIYSIPRPPSSKEAEGEEKELKES